MRMLVLACELAIALVVSTVVLLWIGSTYVVVAVIVGIICTLMLMRPGKGVGWVSGLLILIFGFSLGILWPSLPLIIAKGDLKRRRKIATAKRAGVDSGVPAEPAV